MSINNHGKFQVGDVIQRADKGPFASGCCVDYYGVVIQSNPLIFTTENGDVKWSASVNDWELVFVSKANSYDLGLALRRL
jgi:hypothetical protein